MVAMEQRDERQRLGYQTWSPNSMTPISQYPMPMMNPLYQRLLLQRADQGDYLGANPNYLGLMGNGLERNMGISNTLSRMTRDNLGWKFGSNQIFGGSMANGELSRHTMAGYSNVGNSWRSSINDSSGNMSSIAYP